MVPLKDNKFLFMKVNYCLSSPEIIIVDSIPVVHTTFVTLL